MVIYYALFGDVVTFDTIFCTNKKNRPFGVFSGFNHHSRVIRFGASLLYDKKAKSFKWLFETFLESYRQKKPITFFTDQDVAMTKTISEVFPETCHGLKQKWAICYMKNAFTRGMRSTQLSESINADLKDYTKCTLDIVYFFKHFERVVNDKRASKLKVEFDSINKLPRNTFTYSPIMVQAIEVYTLLIFGLFHNEYALVGWCHIKENDESNTLHKYVVDVLNSTEVEYIVKYNSSESIVECSCRKFKSFGILCCHALKIMERLDIKYIPEAYILNRWTRKARRIVVEDISQKEVEEDINLDSTQRYKILCSKLVKIVSQASNSVEGYALVNNVASFSFVINCLTFYAYAQRSFDYSMDCIYSSQVSISQANIDLFVSQYSIPSAMGASSVNLFHDLNVYLT
ncbi:protein FAR-RED ELONGATED HYPOCOTYL 3-like [Telopea speciosissima]|uniref:protein FAR-RED ELONGATED HYPOCOTYL 3-like n=1 Tax=Telopea speciosissima TaxID=54955 RepID=UPI001CC33D98|nr:protein FAR-RED ELONGATED HYPOCOTYL 3-like [Telopea speciosissima]